MRSVWNEMSMSVHTSMECLQVFINNNHEVKRNKCTKTILLWEWSFENVVSWFFNSPPSLKRLEYFQAVLFELRLTKNCQVSRFCLEWHKSQCQIVWKKNPIDENEVNGKRLVSLGVVRMLSGSGWDITFQWKGRVLFVLPVFSHCFLGGT